MELTQPSRPAMTRFEEFHSLLRSELKRFGDVIDQRGQYVMARRRPESRRSSIVSKANQGVYIAMGGLTIEFRFYI